MSQHSISKLLEAWQKMTISAWAMHKYGWILEDGQPIDMLDWQRIILREYDKRQADVSTLFLSTIKKTGKTTLSSLIVCYRWLVLPSVHFVVANDKAQSEELQFNIISGMINRHPILKRYSKITKSEILFEPTGSRIVSLPMDAAGAAGANFATVSFSELWGYRYEEGQRLYEELTPIPGDCLRVIDSYAGFYNESLLLERVWQRGEAGQQVNDDWPIYLSGQQLSYIHQGEDAQRACWRGSDEDRKKYYTEQESSLRPGTFSRLHLNLWTTGEGDFVSLEDWQALIDDTHKPLEPGSNKPVYVGLDLATASGGDDCALIGVYSENGLTKIAFHKIWRGKTRRTPLKLTETVMPYILRIKQSYNLRGIFYDPFQAALLSEQLKKSGVKCYEIKQTHSTRAPKDTRLMQMIEDRQLVLYPDEELERASSGASCKELPNGLVFLKKASGRSKIDLMVALANVADEANKNRGWWTGSWNGRLDENTEYLSGDGKTYIGKRRGGIRITKTENGQTVEYGLKSEEELNPQPKQVKRKRKRKRKQSPSISLYEF